MSRTTMALLMTMSVTWLAPVTLLAVPQPKPAGSEPANVLPAQLENVGIEQRIGERIPLDGAWVDSSGQSVELGDLFGERPVILAPVYYECPMLCQLVLEGLMRSLKVVEFTPAKDYELVVFSIDPAETPDQAGAKKTAAVERFGAEEAPPGWHFLTGGADEIAELTDAIGFGYEYDDSLGQFMHAASIMVLTPEGEVARYLYGIDYAPKDLRFSLIEASENRLGSVIDQALMYCYRYDPSTAKYTVLTMRLVRIGGALTVLAIAAFIIMMLRWERQAAANHQHSLESSR